MHLTSVVWLNLNILPDFTSKEPTLTQLEVSCAEYFSNLSRLWNNLDYSLHKGKRLHKMHFAVNPSRVKFRPSLQSAVPLSPKLC